MGTRTTIVVRLKNKSDHENNFASSENLKSKKELWNYNMNETYGQFFMRILNLTEEGLKCVSFWYAGAIKGNFNNLVDEKPVGFWVKQPTSTEKAKRAKDPLPVVPKFELLSVKVEEKPEVGPVDGYDDTLDYINKLEGDNPHHSQAEHNSVLNRIDPYIRDEIRSLFHSDQTEGMIAEDKACGFVHKNFLVSCLKAAESVAALACFDQVLGSGNLYKNSAGTLFLLTNNHVINSKNLVWNWTFYLDYDDENTTGRSGPYKLDSSKVFYFSPEGELDYTIVAIHADSVASVSKNREGADRGVLSMASFRNLIAEPLKAPEALNIIGHPAGAPQCFSIRGFNFLKSNATEKRLVFGRVVDLLTHGAYTLAGSSGSTVFDDAWRPCALHRSKGQCVLDKNGNTQVLNRVTKQVEDFDYTRHTIEDVLYKYNIAVPLIEIFQHSVNQGLIM